MMSKNYIMFFSVIFFLTIHMYGCDNSGSTAATKKSDEPGIIDTMTGKTQIDAFHKMKTTLESVRKSREDETWE